MENIPKKISGCSRATPWSYRERAFVRLRIAVMFALLTSVPVWGQADNGAAGQAEDTQMQTPPPVSGAAFPTAVGNEERSNYLRMGVTVSGGYIDNLYAGEAGSPLSETTVTVDPTISFDRSSSVQHATVSYSPGFTFYQPTSVLNEATQTAAAEYSLRFTPHTEMILSDAFQDSSMAFGSAYAGVGGTVSGSLQSQAPGVVPPFAQMRSNMANGEFTEQLSRASMFGVSGMDSILQYPNSSETAGLDNSSARRGSIFYNRRISGSQYAGVTYQYSDFLTYPAVGTSQTQTHSINAFYSYSPTKRLSLSVSGGPQYYTVSETSLPAQNGWGPSVIASMGWQGDRTSFAASYSREVTGGGGVLGAFSTSIAGASAGWQATRNWMAAATASYSDYQTLTSLAITGEQGGHSISGGINLHRNLGQQLQFGLEYDRIHESYAEISSIASNPNSDREIVSLTWRFARPFGE